MKRPRACPIHQLVSLSFSTRITSKLILGGTLYRVRVSLIISINEEDVDEIRMTWVEDWDFSA